MNISDIAKICHEANRAYCAGLGDMSQVPWEDAPEWQRSSAISGVEFAITHPDALPSVQHDCWLADKKSDGWRYGPVKDPTKKEHPCIVPYDELPPEERTKDLLFQSIVKACSALIK